MASREVCRLIVLGSTGSIGTQTLEVVEHLNGLRARGTWPTRYEVVGLAGGKNQQLLGEQAAKFGVRDLALGGMRSDVVMEFSRHFHGRWRAGIDTLRSIWPHITKELQGKG